MGLLLLILAIILIGFGCLTFMGLAPVSSLMRRSTLNDKLALILTIILFGLGVIFTLLLFTAICVGLVNFIWWMI